MATASAAKQTPAARSTARRRAGRHAVAVVLALALAAAAPILHRVVANDLAASRALGDLVTPLPPKTQVLKVATDVGLRDGVCQLLAAKVLATELAPEELARRLTAPASLDQELWVAWAAPGRFTASPVDTGELATPRRPPRAVEKLLSQWMVLPDGVRRIAVFATQPAPSLAEARCW